MFEFENKTDICNSINHIPHKPVKQTKMKLFKFENKIDIMLFYLNDKISKEGTHIKHCQTATI